MKINIIAIVNIILGNRNSEENATSAQFIIDGNNLSMSADGVVGAFEMTLSHDANFSFELAANTTLEGVSAYRTDGTSTKIVVVTPENGRILDMNFINKIFDPY